MKCISLGHEEHVNNINFDSGGKRLASCSDDCCIKVWDFDSNGETILSHSWKMHKEKVIKAIFADFIFGSIIASCSTHSINIWEETNVSEDNRKTWISRSTFNDSNITMSDITFSPKSIGLLIGACSKDGLLRIYQPNNLIDLTNWCLKCEIHLTIGCSCLSWSDSMHLHFAINFSSLCSSIAIGFDKVHNAEQNKEGMPRVASYSHYLDLINLNENLLSWEKINTDQIMDSLSTVHHLAFAPSSHRDFHLLAIASNTLRLFKIYPKNDLKNQPESILEIFNYKDHIVDVYRICWNITGTVIFSISTDGSLSSHRQNTNEEWNCCFISKPNSQIKNSLSQSEIEANHSYLEGLGSKYIPLSMW